MNIQHPYNNVNNNFQNQPYNQTPTRPPFSHPNSYNHGTPGPLDASQLMQQRLQDASQRQHSPSSSVLNGYNVNSVVPAKRQRPAEDDNNNNNNMSASPRTGPGGGQFGASRSQTPQQQSNFPGAFPPNLATQPSNPYLHLQQQHASPNGMSPSMGAQGQQPWPTQARQHQTSQSPQMMNNNISLGQLAQQQQANQNNSQQQPGFGAQDQREAQQRYKAQLQAQQHKLNANAVNFPGRPNAPAQPNNSSGSPYNGMQQQHHNQQQQQQQQQQMTPQQAQAAKAKAKANEQSFMHSLTEYLARNNQSPEPNPQICDRPVSYFQLFDTVTGHRILLPGPNLNNWSFVAVQLGFNPAEYPTAADEAQALFSRNLLGFVQVWTQIVQKRKMKQQQQQQQQQPPTTMGGISTGPFAQMSPVTAQQTFSRPGQQMPGQMFPPNPKQPITNNSVQGTPQSNRMSPLQNNGPFAPQTGSVDQGGPLREMSQPLSATGQAPVDSRDQQLDTKSVESTLQPKVEENAQDAIVSATPQALGEPQDKENYRPRTRVLLSTEDPYHGGLPVDKLIQIAEKVDKFRPGVPTYEDMGVVDIHALTMSIQSGVHGEIRYALDQLVSLTHDTRVNFSLGECEGLLEALVDCGDEQLDTLIQYSNSAPSDHIDFPNFKKLAKSSWKERFYLEEQQIFASVDYKVKHAADRLIAITTIFRNLSIPDSLHNHDVMTRETFVSFIASSLRAIGLRPALLQSSQSLVDFMKDVVTLLSNIAHRLEIPSREDAASLLHFLLAFAPQASPTMDEKTCRLTFYPYEPRQNQYLPSAIDALAKLFARDDPNRSFLRSILASDSTKSPACCLLTRAFALAIAPIPNRQSPHIVSERNDLIRIAQERNPFLTQGMLAGDILATLLQGADDTLARDWLTSEDGWAPSLLQLLIQLGFERGTTSQVRSHGRVIDYEAGGCSLIAQRGLSMLKRLVEKIDKSDGVDIEDLFGIQPQREMVLHALTNGAFEVGALRHLVAFAGLEG